MLFGGMCQEPGSGQHHTFRKFGTDISAAKQTIMPNLNKSIREYVKKKSSTFKKYFGFDRFASISFRKITSTSSANTQSLEQKLNEWSIIRTYLMNDLM